MSCVLSLHRWGHWDTSVVEQQHMEVSRMPTFQKFLTEITKAKNFPRKVLQWERSKVNAGLGQALVLWPPCDPHGAISVHSFLIFFFYSAFILPLVSTGRLTVVEGHLSYPEWTEKDRSPSPVPSLLSQHLLPAAGSSWGYWAGTQADQCRVLLRTLLAEY